MNKSNYEKLLLIETGGKNSCIDGREEINGSAVDSSNVADALKALA